MEMMNARPDFSGPTLAELEGGAVLANARPLVAGMDRTPPPSAAPLEGEAAGPVDAPAYPAQFRARVVGLVRSGVLEQLDDATDALAEGRPISDKRGAVMAVGALALMTWGASLIARKVGIVGGVVGAAVGTLLILGLDIAAKRAALRFDPAALEGFDDAE